MDKKITCRGKSGIVLSLEGNNIHVSILEEVDNRLLRKMISRTFPEIIPISKVKGIMLKNNTIRITLRGTFVKREMEVHLEPECARKFYEALLSKLNTR